jgi:aminoglycoside phosphotransferase (APT) family kinase protein
MPAAEVVIDAPLVRTLLQDQHPDLAALPLTHPVFGWDNVMFRLGDELQVRLPRRLASAPLILREQRWLPELAPVLPLPVPAPLRVGRPGEGYPWAWSVCTWLPGGPAATTPPRDAADAAHALGEFLRALHRPAPADAPYNRFRGVPLVDRDAALHERLEYLGDEVDARAVRDLWTDCLAAPAWSSPALWLHGDLHPANVLVHAGTVSAVIDFGDITAGDPATDLSVAWMMLPPSARHVLRAAAGDVDDDTWARARGWALALAVAILSGSGDNAIMATIARTTLDAVLSDER